MQEGLAAVYTIRYFLSYLKYAHFYLITDHQALKYLLDSVEPRGMFARWIAFLSTLNFTVQHRPGKELAVPDLLSRRQYPDKEVDNDSFFQTPPSTQSFPFGIDTGTQTDPLPLEDEPTNTQDQLPDIFRIDDSGIAPTDDREFSIRAPLAPSQHVTLTSPADRCLAARTAPGVRPRHMNHLVRLPACSSVCPGRYY